MNYKMMGRLDALILTVEAVFMLPALLISLFGGEKIAAQSFLVSMGIILAVAAAVFGATFAIRSKSMTRG